MTTKLQFPRHVYKKHGPIKWNYGLTYAREYVTDRKQYDAALKAGYIDDFNEALYGEEVEEAEFEEIIETKPEVDVEIDDF